MSGHGTTDANFILKQKKYLAKFFAFSSLRKVAEVERLVRLVQLMHRNIRSQVTVNGSFH